MSDQIAALGHAPFGPSNAQTGARRTIRGLLLAMLVAWFVIATTMTGQSTARLTYPFLDAGPLRAPDIVYIPSYFPAEAQHLVLKFGSSGAGTDFEMRQDLPSGGELIIWESTRFDATVEEAVGLYHDETEVRGAVAVWSSGHAANGGATVLHARIGQTLVVITGALSTGELLRIADSLRRGLPSSMML